MSIGGGGAGEITPLEAVLCVILSSCSCGGFVLCAAAEY